MDTVTVKYIRTKINDRPFHLFMVSLRELLRTEVVYLTSMFYPLSFLLFPFAMLFGKKTVWSVRGELSPEALKIKPRLKRPILGIVSRFSKNVVFHATNPSEQQDIIKAVGPTAKVVELPLLIELPEKVQMPLRQQLLFLGRIHPIKGIDLLIKALAISKHFKGSAYRLVIAGKGDDAYIAQLKSLANELGVGEKIDWIGPIDGLEKQQLYASSACSLLPSYSENFGATVAESLAQGTPAMASTNTPWQSLNDTKAGWWVSHEPSSIAAMLDELISMKDYDYLQMRENASRLVRDKFDLYANIGQYSQFFNALAA